MPANSAKASVIMAKKINLTRRENAPISVATSAERRTAMPKPRRRWPGVGAPKRPTASATEYAPKPKNIACPKETMPV
jgi:hypothetical protein